MEHVVFFPAQDGSPAFRRVGSLEDAIRLVEHLRNVEGVQEVSCHVLTEVPLAFRAYYRVEVPQQPEAETGPPVEASAELSQLLAEPEPAGWAADAAAVPAADPDPVPVQFAPELSPEPEPEPAAAVNGRSGDGAKSLGFFA